MRAVVTGGAGFIGSHLVDALIARGHRVMVLDHLSRRHAHNLRDAEARGAELVPGDVRDVERTVAAFQRMRPEIVFHLAAQIDVRRSVDDPSTDAFVNIGGTASALEAARRTGVRRFVLASTAGVYGEPERIPTPEDSPVRPLSPYGAGKGAAETYLELFSRLHDLSTLSLRMANVYGPRQDAHGEAGVVAIFCAAAAAGQPATIYGDGGQTRDFVFVADVVDAFLAAGNADVRGVLNVATGTETSLLELAGGLGLQTDRRPSRLGEIRRSCLDPAAAHRDLGWSARTPLAEGLRRTVGDFAP